MAERKPPGKPRRQWVSADEFLRAVSAAEDLDLARITASGLIDPKIRGAIEDLMQGTKRSRPDSPPVTAGPGIDLARDKDAKRSDKID